MRNNMADWEYEAGTPVDEMEEGYAEDGLQADNYTGLYGDEESYDDGYDDFDDYSEDLGNYGSDLSGCLEEGASLEDQERADRSKEAAFLLNETNQFSKRADAELIHKNFKKYVEDVKSGDATAVQAAAEGACRDLEFFMISIITRSFSTYTEKDRSFYEDLMQAGRMGIIQALPKYDPERTMPTTYFCNPIKHEMVLQVNSMKHDTKSHVATTKRKIQEVDKMFARYGRTPTLHDYVYSIKCPFHRIVNALAELKAGNTKTSIDDPDAAPLADKQSSMCSPEENAISNMNAGKIIKIAYELEPRREIVECFLEMRLSGKVKTSELSEKYGLPASEITEGVRNLENLLRYHPDMRKMYPEKFRMKEHELSEQMTYMPVEEGEMAMENVLDSLRAMADGEDLEISMG